MGEFIKRYPRTVKDSLRREDDKRKKKRKEVEERKKHEKEQKKEEIKMLKNMKKKEIMEKLEKLKQITGNDDMEMDEDDIEGDFDPEKYDKKMKEIFQNYDDDLQVDEEKPTFSDLEDDEFDDNYGEDFEDWDNWTGGKGGDQDEDDSDGLLTRRKKTLEETKQEEEDYKQWLAGQKNDVEDDSLKKKMSGLREYWNESQLDEGEKFLKDYILNKRYLDQDNDEYVPSYDEIVHDSDEDLSEDERNVEKQEEFEHKFNFRFEEPDEEFIKRYPRTVKDSLRREDDKRAKKRKEVEERKKMEKQ